MPRRFPAMALAMTAVAVLACNSLPGSRPAPATATPEPRSAQLTELQKTVESQAEANTTWQLAAVGQTILAGGGARTQDEARARLDISDGSIVRLAANTSFRLLELAPGFADPVTRLELAAGKVWVLVTKALGLGIFEVETPAGVSGVRGSLMSVEYDPATGRMTVTCLEGQCYLAGASGATINLGAGEQSEIAGAGLDPAPARLIDDVQLAEWTQEFPEAQAAVATATAAPRPSATPAPTATLAPQSACDHPYFPLRQGAAWQRSRNLGASQWTWAVEAVDGDLSSASATVSDSAEDIRLTYTWKCTAEGIAYFRLEDIGAMAATIVTYYNTVDSFYGTDSAADVAAINYTPSDQSGVSLPAPAGLRPGATWTHAYSLQYTGQPAADPGAFINYVLDVSETHTAGNEQTLDTPAGAFTVIPVVVQLSGTETYEFSHGSRGVGKVGPNQDPFSSTSTIYYAYGVGIVRIEWTSDANNIISELESYSLPR